MAHGTKAPLGQTTAPTPVSNGSNGVITSSPVPSAAGVNRKKAKRRAKEAAKRAAEQEHTLREAAAGNANVKNGLLIHPQSHTSNSGSVSQNGQDALDYGDDVYSDPDGYESEHYYSGDDRSFNEHYDSGFTNGVQGRQHTSLDSSKKSKKKKKGKGATQDPYAHATHQYHTGAHSHAHAHAHSHSHAHAHVPPPPPPPPPPAMSTAALRTVQKNSKGDRIWNTSTQEERERIKEFWLSLKEDERKSLVKIEKEAVLRKMKEQQKHSCSCTVCGRKRTAIEEELEVLYDAYYEELEQYANKGIAWPSIADALPLPLL
jgi:hypothetical protein